MKILQSTLIKIILIKLQEFNPLILLFNCFNSPPNGGFPVKYPVALLEMHDLDFYLIKQQSVSKLFEAF